MSDINGTKTAYLETGRQNLLDCQNFIQLNYKTLSNFILRLKLTKLHLVLQNMIKI